MSFVFLVAFELLMVLFLPRVTKKLGLAWRVANVTYACPHNPSQLSPLIPLSPL